MKTQKNMTYLAARLPAFQIIFSAIGSTFQYAEMIYQMLCFHLF